MIDIHLYRSRIGHFIPSIRNLKLNKLKDEYLKHRLGRIFILICIVMSILTPLSEGSEEDEKSFVVGFLRVKNFTPIGENQLQ